MCVFNDLAFSSSGESRHGKRPLLICSLPVMYGCIFRQSQGIYLSCPCKQTLCRVDETYDHKHLLPSSPLPVVKRNENDPHNPSRLFTGRYSLGHQAVSGNAGVQQHNLRHVHHPAGSALSRRKNQNLCATTALNSLYTWVCRFMEDRR